MAEENATLYAYGVPVSNQNNSAKDMLINIPNLDADNVEDGIKTLDDNINGFKVHTLKDNWYSSHNVEGNIPLNDNINNYDLIIICAGYLGSGCVGSTILPTHRLKRSTTGNRIQLVNGGHGYYINDTTLAWTPINNMYIDVYGIRFTSR